MFLNVCQRPLVWEWDVSRNEGGSRGKTKHVHFTCLPQDLCADVLTLHIRLHGGRRPLTRGGAFYCYFHVSLFVACLKHVRGFDFSSSSSSPSPFVSLQRLFSPSIHCRHWERGFSKAVKNKLKNNHFHFINQ